MSASAAWSLATRLLAVKPDRRNLAQWHDRLVPVARGYAFGRSNLLPRGNYREDSEESGRMHRIGSIAELQAGSPLRATVEGTKILVFMVDSKPVATAARCPHAQGPLHQGEICNGQLICPWHGWTFNLPSGMCEEDPDLILTTYNVRVEGEDILVAVHAPA
jgi:nitrite reductase (NADH) small subunit